MALFKPRRHHQHKNEGRMIMIAVCTEGNLSLISVNRRLVYIAHSAEEKGKAIRAIYRMMKGGKWHGDLTEEDL